MSKTAKVLIFILFAWNMYLTSASWGTSIMVGSLIRIANAQSDVNTGIVDLIEIKHNSSGSDYRHNIKNFNMASLLSELK